MVAMVGTWGSIIWIESQYQLQSNGLRCSYCRYVYIYVKIGKKVDSGDKVFVGISWVSVEENL